MNEIINKLISIYNAEKLEKLNKVDNNKFYILEEANKCIFLKYIKLKDNEYNYFFVIVKKNNSYNIKTSFMYEEFDNNCADIDETIEYIEEQLELETFCKNAFTYLNRIIDGSIKGETFIYKRNVENILKYMNYSSFPLFKLYIQENKTDTITLTPSDEFKEAYKGI